MSTDDHLNPDAGGDDDAESEQPDIVVDDPEDFAKTRQLRSIFDARDDYIDARRDSNRLYEEGELSHTKRNRRLFRHLQDLAMTMEPLLKSYESGEEIWEDAIYSDDGTFVAAASLASFDEALNEIESIAKSSRQSAQGVKKAQELYEQYQQEKQNGSFTYSGNLDEVKAKMRVYSTDWGWRIQGLGNLIKRTHKLKYVKNLRKNKFGTTAPPQEVCDAAFRDLQDFIRDIGLGVQFDTEQQTKIDDDLLEEVDTWRQQNVN